jgi:hypothetical protein
MSGVCLHALVELPGGDHGDDFISVAKNPAPGLSSLTFVVKNHWNLEDMTPAKFNADHGSGWEGMGAEGGDALTFWRWCCVMASMAVICARMSAEVKIMSTGSSLMRVPASIASSTPFCDSGTSTHPVKRFFEFQSDSPWRISINADSPAIKIPKSSKTHLDRHD